MERIKLNIQRFASGTIWMSTDGALTGKIEWSSSTNGSVANTSNVTATLYIRRTDSNTTTGKDWNGYISIGGDDSYLTYSSRISVGSDWVWMGSYTRTVNHNSNGTGSCFIRATMNGPDGTSLAGRTIMGSQWVTLDTIPRASSFSSITADNMDGNITFNFDIKNSGFTHKILWFVNNEQIGEFTPTISNNKCVKAFTATDIYYELADDYQTKIPLWPSNSSKINVKFRLITYSGTQQIGDVYDKTIEVSLGSAYNPSHPTLAVSQNAQVETKFGAYIQNKSDIIMALSGSNLTKLNATISKYGFYYLSNENRDDNKTTLQSSATYSFVPSSSGVYALRGFVEDSRGLQDPLDVSTMQTINVVPYGNPIINTFTAERSDEQDEQGRTSVDVNVACSVYSLNQKNDKRAVIKWVDTNDETVTGQLDITSSFVLGAASNTPLLSTYTADDEAEESESIPKYIINDTFTIPTIDGDTEFDFWLELTDYFSTNPTTKSAHIGTAFTLMCFNSSGNGMAFGKVCDETLSNTIEVADNMTMLYHGVEVGTGGGGDTLPYGSIVDYDGDSVPSGYEEVNITYLKVKENTSGQSIGAGTYSIIQFNQVNDDTKNSFNKSAYSYTIPENGLYFFHIQVGFTNYSGISRCVIKLEKNGEAVEWNVASISPSSGNAQINTLRYCNKNEVYRVQGKVDSYASNVDTGDSTVFQLFKLN